MKAIRIKNSDIKTTKKLMQSVTMFINKFRIPISNFLLENKEYRVFNVSVTKHECGDLELEVALYEDGQNHCYLNDLTKEELQRCMKELDSKVTI